MGNKFLQEVLICREHIRVEGDIERCGTATVYACVDEILVHRLDVQPRPKWRRSDECSAPATTHVSSVDKVFVRAEETWNEGKNL